MELSQSELAGGPVNQYQAFACSLNTHPSRTAQKKKPFTGPNVVYLGEGVSVKMVLCQRQQSPAQPLGTLVFFAQVLVLVTFCSYLIKLQQ